MLTTQPKPWASAQSVEEAAHQHSAMESVRERATSTTQPNEHRIEISEEEARAVSTLPERIRAREDIEAVPLHTDNLRLRHEWTGDKGYVLYGPLQRLREAVTRAQALDAA